MENSNYEAIIALDQNINCERIEKTVQSRSRRAFVRP
jgi:hypothetical protein